MAKARLWRNLLFTTLIATLALTSGCSHRFQPEASTVTTITPLTVKAEGMNQQQLNAFLHNHRRLLLTEPVTLGWSHTRDRTLVNRFVDQLLALGADRENLSVREIPEGVPGVTVSYITHRALTPQCQPYRTIHLFSQDTRQQGCFVDSNRWQSLVHPERAYGGPATVSHP